MADYSNVSDTFLEGGIVSNNVYAFEMSGTAVANMDESDLFLDNSFTQIETDYAQGERQGDMIQLSNKTYYVIIEHDINNSIVHVGNHAVDDNSNNALDDAWGLNAVTFNVPSNVLYHADTTRKLPLMESDNNDICLAYIPVRFPPHMSIGGDTYASAFTGGRIDVKTQVNSTEQGYYNTSRDNFIFKFGLNILGNPAPELLSTATVNERLKQFQVLGYKKKNSDHSTVTTYLVDNNIDLADATSFSGRDDVLVGSIKLNQLEAEKTDLGLTKLKEWYDSELESIVTSIKGQNTIDSILVTLNKVEPTSDNRLSSLARSRLTITGNAEEENWVNRGTIVTDKTKLFAEGDYVILSDNFNYAPTLCDSNGDKNDFSMSDGLKGPAVFVVLKQVTPQALQASSPVSNPNITTVVNVADPDPLVIE